MVTKALVKIKGEKRIGEKLPTVFSYPPPVATHHISKRTTGDAHATHPINFPKSFSYGLRHDICG
jgi:hypothetical protein